MSKLYISILSLFTALIIPLKAFPQTGEVSSFLPSSITIYPHSAQLTVKTTAQPSRAETGETFISAYLPGSADPKTIKIEMKNQIHAIKTKQLPEEDYNDPIRKPWFDALKTAEQQYNSILSELNTTKKIVEMWSQPLTPTTNLADELIKMSAAMNENLIAANTKMLELEVKLKEAEEYVNQARDALEKLKPSFEVTFILAKPNNTIQNISYSYTVKDCEWHPIYTLNAFPDKKSINFVFSAKILQNTGFDWQNTELNLATNAPTKIIAPPNLPIWKIGKEENTDSDLQMGKARMSMAEERSMADAPLMSAGNAAEPVSIPEEIIYSTYSVWNMGKQNIPNAKETVYPVQEENLEAKFHDTARPGVSDKAFLTAILAESAEKKILPKSQAIFLVEGNSIGTGVYPVSDNVLFFGPDPLVSLKYFEITNQHDEQGFIGKTQISRWHWKIEAKNNHKLPQKLIIEEPMPMLNNAKIELKVTSNPMPSEDETKHVYSWEQEIAPNGSWTIEHKLEASAPKDVSLKSSK